MSSNMFHTVYLLVSISFHVSPRLQYDVYSAKECAEKPSMCCTLDIFAVCLRNHFLLLQLNVISQSVSVLVSAVDVPGPFDHSLWRAIQEDQFGVKLLFQLQLSRLTHLKHKNKEEEVNMEPAVSCLIHYSKDK